MTTVNELHGQAMDLVELAILARLRGNTDEVSLLYTRALQLELAAIEGLDPSIEPTFSVLHRSAGTMALHSHQPRLAEQLAAKALSYEPPSEIADELRDLIEQANYQRHLELKGIQLTEDELQMSLSGKAVLPGLIAWAELSGRITDTATLFLRLMERQRNRRFREGGAPPRDIRQGHQLLVSTARPASYAVTLRFAALNSQFRLPGDMAETVDEFMDLMELVNRSEVSDVDIQQRIPDPAYLRNFLALAKKIAPDGDQINQVGFTLRRDNDERSVSVTKPASQFPLPPVGGPELAPKEPEAVEIRGLLLYADGTRDGQNRIKIIPGNGKGQFVRVPEGLMDDIVRPMWNSQVVVKALKNGRTIELQEISLALED